MLTPNAVLDFFHIQDHGILAHFVSTLLIIKIYLLGLLVAYVIFQRLKRAWSRRNNRERSDRLRLQIGRFLTTDHPETEKIEVSKLDRLFLRRLLLEELESSEIEARLRLQILYRRMGFFESDLRDLKAKSWPKRLAAVIRLETLRTNDSTHALYPLIDDSNDLVAIATMRALSALDFAENIQRILDSLGRRAPARKDIFVEILSNIGQAHAYKILDYLKECFDPVIAAICISVIGQLRVKSAVPLLLNLLKSSDDDVAAESIKALGRIGVVEARSDIRELLTHEAPQVRAEAMIALIQLGDSDFALNLKSIQADPSPIVRRALFEGKS